MVVLKNTQLAFLSSVLYCFNPASVFFLASYTETIFTLLS